MDRAGLTMDEISGKFAGKTRARRAEQEGLDMDNVVELLRRLTDIRPMLGALGRGAVIRATLGTAGQVLSVLIGLGLLVHWVYAWRTIAILGFFGTLAFIVWQAAYLLAAFLALKVLFVRSAEIKALPDSDFTVLPIMVVLIKAMGEMSFVFLAVMSAPLLLLLWLGGDGLLHAFGLATDKNFLAGIAGFVFAWLAAFGSLLLAYFTAEWTMALFSIANDANLLRRHFTPRSDSVSKDAAKQPDAAEKQ